MIRLVLVAKAKNLSRRRRVRKAYPSSSLASFTQGAVAL